MNQENEQPNKLGNLLREISECLEYMQDYYYLPKEYQAKAAALLYKLMEYNETSKRHKPNP